MFVETLLYVSVPISRDVSTERTSHSRYWFFLKTFWFEHVDPSILFSFWINGKKIETGFKIPYNTLQISLQHSSKFPTTHFKIPYNAFQNSPQHSSKFHATHFKIPYNTSKFPATHFKIPYNTLQNSLQHTSKFPATLFKIPCNRLQNSLQHTSKFPTTLFKIYLKYVSVATTLRNESHRTPQTQSPISLF